MLHTLATALDIYIYEHYYNFLHFLSAFGWKAPKFAHMPLLVNSDGRKLSKRQNDITVDYYRAQKIYPLALVNFMIYTGGGFAKDAGGDEKSRTLDDLEKQVFFICNSDKVFLAFNWKFARFFFLDLV